MGDAERSGNPEKLGKDASAEALEAKPCPRTAFGRTVARLAEVSTIHGLRYCLNLRSPLLERFLWCAISLGATLAAFAMSIGIFVNWKENPTVTTIGTTSRPITDMEFPAVTLCSPGNDISSLYKIPYILDDLWKNSGDWSNFSEYSDSERESAVLAFAREQIPSWPSDLTLDQFMLCMTNFSQEDNDAFTDMDFSSKGGHRTLLALLWFSGLPCKRLLRRCSWKGSEVPCERMFSMVPTDTGFCCSFNHRPLNEKLRESDFVRYLEDIERKYSSYGKDTVGKPESGYAPLDMSPQAGQQNGLSVVLNTSPVDDSDISSVRHDFAGDHAAISTRHNFPMMTRSDTFLVPPGQLTSVVLGAEMTSTAPSLRDLDPVVRKCYFDDEYHLQLFSRYSITNCWMECLLNLSRAELPSGCVPWNLPSPSLSPPCRPADQRTFMDKFHFLDMNKIIGSELCLPSCAGTTYRYSVSSAPLLSKFENSSETASLRIYFSQPVVTELVTSARMSWAEYVSNVGGLLGIFLGFSLISGVEVVYWLTIGYAEFRLGKNKDNRTRATATRKISVETMQSSAS